MVDYNPGAKSASTLTAALKMTISEAAEIFILNSLHVCCQCSFAREDAFPLSGKCAYFTVGPFLINHLYMESTLNILQRFF